jgi:hypothetical protein
MRRACRSCAGAEVQTVGPSVGQDFVDRVRSTGQLPEMYSDPTRAQVHLLATFFRGHRTYPGTPNGSSGSEARRLGHGLKPPHRDPRTPSTPASCRSNTADQLRSGAPVRLARGGTGRHLSVPYGCRPELRQLHPLVRWRCSLQVFWRESCVLRDSGEHSGTQFLAIVKGEHVVGPTRAREGPMGTRLALDRPANTLQR